MDDIKLWEKRNYLVVKSNDLVQKSRYELSLLEQKVVACICSLIKPEHAKEAMENGHTLEYQFNIRDFCRICGIDCNNGKNYINVRAVLKKLSDRSIWLTMPDGKIVLCRWLSKVKIQPRSGIAEIRLDEDMVPYLFDLNEKFIRYNLKDILAMQSAYSIRVFEILKSHSFKKKVEYQFDDLKKLLYVENIKVYDNFKDFRVKILDKSIAEINSLTDINVFYEIKKEGRKTNSIVFYISKKNIREITVSTIKVRSLLEAQ